MTVWKLHKGRINFAVGTLSTNYHGTGGTTKRWSTLLSRFGDDNPLSWRCWRVYLYRGDGACVHFDFQWVRPGHG